MTPDRIALIQESYGEAQRLLEPGDRRFLARLFGQNPEMRALFREDLYGQGMKFLATLGAIVEATESPEALQAVARELGEGHAALGVEPRHYAPLEDALLDTLGELLENRWTPAHADAWREAYAILAALMIDASLDAQGEGV